jgi:Ca2+/Na+ antiporter
MLLLHGELPPGATDAEKAGANSAVTLGLSAIIGSGMLAFLLAPAVCALGANQVLKLNRRPLAKNIGFYVVSLAGLCIFLRDGVITTHESGTLLVLYFLYLFVTWVAPTVHARYRTWRYGPLPQDKRQMNFVEERRAQMQQQQMLTASQQQQSAMQGGVGTASAAAAADDDEHEWSAVSCVGALCTRPLRLVFKLTCPDCSEGAKYERWYFVTLATAFLWVSLFSYAISEVVSSWEEKLGVSTIILGITLVAVGGEIPDTIQSLAVVCTLAVVAGICLCDARFRR